MKVARVLATLTASAALLLAAGAARSADVESKPGTVSPAPRPLAVLREYKLPFPEGRILRPRISGNWVAAIHNTDQKNPNATAQVVVCNVVTKKVFTLWPEGSYQPDINGNYVTWTGKTSTQQTFRTLNGEPNPQMPSNLLVCDLTTGSYYCPPIGTYNSAFPVVRDHCVAYVDGGHVFLVDMRNGVSQRISNPSKGNMNAGLSMGGDYVTWTTVCDRGRIHVYQISTRRLAPIGEDTSMECSNSATDGKTIVWYGAGEPGGIYSYDIATEQYGGRIAEGTSYLDIDDGLLVYLKPQGTVCYVYGMLTTPGAQEFKISKEIANQGPSVSGNRVVWARDNTVYCAELDRGDKPIAKPLSPTP